MAGAAPLGVGVCWIGAEPPLRVALRVPAGSTVADALAASGIAARIAASGAQSPGQGPLDALTVAVLGRRAAPGWRGESRACPARAGGPGPGSARGPSAARLECSASRGPGRTMDAWPDGPAGRRLTAGNALAR